MWSTILQAWIYIVGQRTGMNPPGTYEITPADIGRMQMFIDDGWPRSQAIYRVMGAKTVAP